MNTSNNTTKIIIVIVVLLVLVGAVVLLMNNRTGAPSTPNNTTPSTSSNNKPSEQSTSPSTSQTNTETTITYDGNSFSPATVTVKMGDTIKLVNSSSEGLEFDSDPHPVHTADPELNIGAVAPGQSKTFTVTTKGTWGYHNHLKSTVTGTIIVQ